MTINAITGTGGNFLEHHIIHAINNAKNIRLIISFVMESGVKTLLPHLEQAADRGVPVKILTGRYLALTEPSALYLLYNYLGDAVEIRFYADTLRSFHPKAYIFDYDYDGELFIGSSNLSRSALTRGVEWNYRLCKSRHPEDFQEFSRTFDELFCDHSVPVTEDVLKEYAWQWKKPWLVRAEEAIDPPRDPYPEPRGAQVEALYYLKEARKEGVKKGLVVAATGVGKTHLAAFDSMGFKNILFLAHREEILNQAHEIFALIRPGAILGFFAGNRKDLDANIYFASVQTLSREQHLRQFSPHYFDYIIVDEFHHAAAESYRKIIEYFTADFLLGLTATPYRMDNRDIFTICDDNVIYEIYLKQAIERDLLVPFNYHALYDPTDYDQVATSGGRYVAGDLEIKLSYQERAQLIYDAYRRMGGQRTVGFCVSIKHAEYMADFFNAQGVAAAAIHSQNQDSATYDRSAAIKALEEGKLKVIFAVDIFNEGVDIPSIDTVLFLRPTESYVIFLQQLGRGLRKYENKEYLTVIDFIGNYKRAHYIPLLLAGQNPAAAEHTVSPRIQRHQFPEGCHVNFDFRIIELFEELARRDPLPLRLKDTYWRIKEELGRRPSRKDIYEGSDIPIREFVRDGWLRFLASLDELYPHEKQWLDTPAEAFLQEIERTRFTKAYKVPVINAFIAGGELSRQVSIDAIGMEFKSFYEENPIHQQDLAKARSTRDWREWELNNWAGLARVNPVHFLSKGQFFHYDEINRVMYLDETLADYLSPELADHVADILEYRRIDYFRKRFR